MDRLTYIQLATVLAAVQDAIEAPDLTLGERNTLALVVKMIIEEMKKL